MKKFLLILCCSLILSSPLYAADDVDLLTDDLLGLTPENGSSASAQKSDYVSEGKENEQSDSFFSFIIKPISDLFKSGDKINIAADGETESPLEKSVKLANDGNLENQMNLGYMYLYGANGVEQDFEKAFHYYDMAAKQNDPIALNNLGSLYFSGIGTKKNYDTALSLFTQASDLGNDNASLNLAFIYLTGGARDSSRNQKAFSLFEKAQKAGNKIAEFMLGYAYYKGFVVKQDYTKAYTLIKSAANGKSQIDEAQLVLADLYTNGQGTVQNYSHAIKSYMAAVNQGNMEAILTLADIFSEGKITPQNLILAHALYNIAAAQNVPDAAQKRDELNEKMPIEALTNAQNTAQNYKVSPSELTSYIRQTYGYNIRNYIDINLPKPQKVK